MADRLDEIKERERLATPGIWRVWDSCSWRRIGIDEPQRKVIEPMNDSDGHPNLLARREDLESAAHARQDIPWLLGELAQAKADLEISERKREEAERALRNLEAWFLKYPSAPSPVDIVTIAIPSQEKPSDKEKS